MCNKMTEYVKDKSILVLFALSPLPVVFAQSLDTGKFTNPDSLGQFKVVSASGFLQKQSEAPANISVVTISGNRGGRFPWGIVGWLGFLGMAAFWYLEKRKR